MLWHWRNPNCNDSVLLNAEILMVGFLQDWNTAWTALDAVTKNVRCLITFATQELKRSWIVRLVLCTEVDPLRTVQTVFLIHVSGPSSSTSCCRCFEKSISCNLFGGRLAVFVAWQSKLNVTKQRCRCCLDRTSAAGVRNKETHEEDGWNVSESV